MHKETLKVPFELPEAFLRENQVVAVLTGGTEAKFLQLVEEGLVDLRKPVFLMVSGHSNSLAAALEILSFICQHYGIGKVISQFTIDMTGKLSDEFEFSECDGYRPASEEEKTLIKDVLKKEHKSINGNGVVDYSGPVRISHIEYGHKSDIIIKGINKDNVDELIKCIKEKL